MYLTRQLVLVFAIVLLLPAIALAQRPGPQFRRPLACEPLEPRTKLEAMEAGGYEKVLIKGFSQIATLNLRGADVRIDAVELKDGSSSMRVTGIVVALRDHGERSSENRSFIDYEEIDPLLKALDTVSKVNETVTKLASFEARYRTLGDLEISVFRQGRSSGTAGSITSGICDKVTGPLTIDDLERFKAHIVEAKARLDAIR